MDKPLDHYWNRRLEDCAEALAKNNFKVARLETPEDARRFIMEEQLPALGMDAAAVLSWGGSMSLVETGVLDALRAQTDYAILDGADPALSWEAKIDIRRKALLADCYLTGTNAVTLTGKLVNLDMIGNRVAALTFGPKHVIVVCGRNKITHDVGEAMARVKDYAGPTNAMRLDMGTPCVKTAYCEDCASPKRICNTWTITEKCFPKERILVVLVNADLGL